MFGYPNFSFPLYRNYNRYNRYSLNTPFISSNMRRLNTPAPLKQYEEVSPPPKEDSIKTVSNEENRNQKDEKSSKNEFLEIFGIKLYFDDLMIISLLFFLYSEGVNDYYLFITLILLLLT